MHGMQACSSCDDVCMVQAKGADAVGYCGRQHAARKAHRVGLQAEHLNKPQDAVSSDEVGMNFWETSKVSA